MKDMPDTIRELLALEATEGLDDAGTAELERLLDKHGVTDRDGYRRAAAAAANAHAHARPETLTPAPADLRAKLLEDASRYFDEADARSPDETVIALPRPVTKPPRRDWGWAAAAVLLLALLMSNFRSGEPRIEDPAAARDALLAAGSEALPWARSRDPDYAGVSGDVVWDDQRQEGYLLLAGMPANDPGVAQYQLWLVDPDRDSNPVDGGVFDVPAGAAAVVIPIDAKLEVSDPAAFAITLEKPGGVVVSEAPLLLVASAG